MKDSYRLKLVDPTPFHTTKRPPYSMSIAKSFIVIVNQNIFGTINNVKKNFKIFITF